MCARPHEQGNVFGIKHLQLAQSLPRQHGQRGRARRRRKIRHEMRKVLGGGLRQLTATMGTILIIEVSCVIAYGIVEVGEDGFVRAFQIEQT